MNRVLQHKKTPALAINVLSPPKNSKAKVGANGKMLS